MNRRGAIAAFLASSAAAAMTPWTIGAKHGAPANAVPFPGWPDTYDGRPLTEFPLTAREAVFLRDFPGRVGRFSDGEREIIIRFVGAPTRLVHSAADCFRANGYAITPAAVRRNRSGLLMASFSASLHGETLTVSELLIDSHGGSWPDVSAWYWNALLGGTNPPWWSFVVAEKSAS
jgi:hypothetical protein